MTARHFGLLVLALVSSCQRKEKPPVRTEPWPAPVVSAQVTDPEGRTLVFAVERGTVHIDLGTKRGKVRGTIQRIEGNIDFDSVRLERTRGSLRADLLDLTLTSGNDATRDAALEVRAFQWLELTPNLPPEQRERDRWASVQITGFDAQQGNRATVRSSKGPITAFGELTLHRFRVPIVLDLLTELTLNTAGEPEALRVRTQKPLMVPLAAHDILPRDARGDLSPSALATLGSDVAKEARVSVDLSLRPVRPAAPSQAPSDNPAQQAHEPSDP